MLTRLRSIAEEAGRKILEIYSQDHGVSYKQDDSPLTRADKAAHESISAALRQHFPDIPIISEEGRLPNFEERRHQERFWLVDPLDGTKEFIKRNGDFTVNIALIEAGRSVAGVVGVPVQERMYSAATGQGAWLQEGSAQPRRLRANNAFDPEKLVASISRSHPSEALDHFLKKFPGLETLGVGSALKFCYVAEGKVDFYPRFGPLWEWDTGAAHLVAEESGCAVRNLDGTPLTYNKPVLKHEKGFLAASSPELLDFLMQRL